jgi:hypothetical protein
MDPSLTEGKGKETNMGLVILAMALVILVFAQDLIFLKM